MRRLLPLAALVALAACGAEPEGEPSRETVERIVARGRPACEARRFEGAAFTVCQADTRRDRIELVVAGPDRRPLRSLAALEQVLRAEAGAVRFAMNAGMYDQDGRPIGLYVESGAEKRTLNLRKGRGNFHLLPNGVFAVERDRRASVTESRRFRRAVPSPLFATQSGPMLVIDGRLHPGFDADGESRHVRNGVGVRDDGRSAFFVISEEPVSFGRFARFFRDALGCRQALYLDGSVSSLWDPGAGRQDGYSELGPMLVVRRGA